MSDPQRGKGVPATQHKDTARYGLPVRPFLYTLDQISTLLDLSIQNLSKDYVFFEGRSSGLAPRVKMIARNIAPPEAKPEWRIAEREFIRWMKVKGFKYYERGVVTH